VIIIACPGQGSQTPGFLEPWLEDRSARIWLESVSERIDIDLVQHGTVSDAETIRSTEIAQPLIVAAGILAWDQLRERLVLRDTDRIAFAGHSVGEITAAYASGVFDADTAIQFVSTRARAMQRCAEATPTGMAAVLGGDPQEVVSHLEKLDLAPANYNGGGQIVAAGTLNDLERLKENPPEKARVMPLRVAGAFHTHFMEPARDDLAGLRQEFVAHTPGADLYTNRDGTKISSGDEFVDSLISQIANPVRWDKCMESFVADDAHGLVELAPAGALTGLAKRGMRGVPSNKLDSPNDLEQTIEFILESSQA
jgi:[acyl-carrier-protein] S-malonyltransferase